MTSMFQEFDFGTSLSKTIMGEVDDAEEAQTSFAVFAPAVIRSEDTGELIELQGFQQTVIDALNSPAKIILFILARGMAKSTLVTIGYTAWRIGNDKNLRVIVASNTKDQAVSHLRGIETILEDRSYQEIFGNLIPSNKKKIKWSEDVKYILRDRKMRDATLRAAGVESAEVLGKRSDIIIVDDLIDIAHADSTIERDKAWRWFSGQLKFTLSKTDKSRIIVINTRFHHDDIAARLKAQYEGASPEEFICVDIPALVRDTVTGEEKSIWESRFPTKDLLQERERNYFEFQSHFMNDPIDVTKSQLQESWLQYVDHTTVHLDEMEFFFGVDPNTDKDTIGKDYFAVVVIGVHPATQRIYLVDLLYTKADLKTLKEQFKALAQRWKPSKILIESNAAQGLYTTILSKEEYLDYPFENIYSTISKEQRILSVANHFIGGRISTLGEKDDAGRWHPIPSLAPIRREWITFPHSRESHFDALDAMDMALRPLISYAAESAVSVITPDEFAKRIQQEQLIRQLRTRAEITDEQMHERLRELEHLSDPVVEQDDDKTKEQLDEELAILEAAYMKSFDIRTPFGTLGRRV